MSLPGHIDTPPRLEVAGIDPNTVSSHQEAIPLPYLAGEGAGALRWISPIYNPKAVEAPQARPAKK